MTEDLDSKNGKKEGVSGSSFFTWFMVIALLGVWTSVAVVWFDLVDYEEVLAKAKDFRYNLSEVLQGKLGVYDADGDGDFDVDDAKVLLGHDPHGVAKPRSKAEVRASIKAQLMKAKEKLKIKKPKVEDKGKSKKEKEDSGKEHAAAEKSKKPAAAEKSKKESGKGKEEKHREKHKEKPGADRERKHKENIRSSRGKDGGKERESSRASRIIARVLRNSGKEDDKKKRK